MAFGMINSSDNSDFTSFSRAEYSLRFSSYNLFPGEISFDERSWCNGPQHLFERSYVNERKTSQISHLLHQHLFVNEPNVYQNPQYMHPKKVSIMEQETNPICYYPNEDKIYESQSQNSYSCFYRKEHSETSGLPDQFNQPFKLPSDYYYGTYPLNVQLPNVFPNINIDIIIDSLSDDINETIERCLTNKSNENVTSVIKELLQPQPAESNSNDNHQLDSNIHQTFKKKMAISKNSNPHYSGSDINQKTYLQSRKSSESYFNSSTDVICPSPAMKSNSNDSLNSSTDNSNSETGSNPDIKCIEDLLPSKHHKFANKFVETEKLNSPMEMISEKLHTGQKLDPSPHQVSNTEAGKIQKSDSILHNLLQSNFYKYRLRNLKNYLFNWKELTKTKDSIVLAKKRSKNRSRASIVTPKNYQRLNSRTTCGNKFGSIKDLQMLLQAVAKFDANGHQGLHPNCTMDANVYIVRLGNCDTTRLFKTFERTKIDEKKMFFEKKLKMAGVTLKIKTRHLQNSESSSSLGTYHESSRNVIVMVYDVTGVFDVHAIRTKIKFLKLAKLPILLIGNTSETTGNRPKIRLVSYIDGCMLKEMYELSLFLECSFESSEEVKSLFITASDFAFRCRL